MQSLEVISVNIWQIIISLCNLVILFLLLKKFLYKPVREMLAKSEALESKAEYEKRLAGAHAEAENIRQNAVLEANRRGDKLLAEAKDKADGIVSKAEAEAELEKRQAREGIRR